MTRASESFALISRGAYTELVTQPSNNAQTQLDHPYIGVVVLLEFEVGRDGVDNDLGVNDPILGVEEKFVKSDFLALMSLHSLADHSVCLSAYSVDGDVELNILRL